MNFPDTTVHRCIECGHRFSVDVKILPEEIYGRKYFEMEHPKWFDNPDLKLFEKLADIVDRKKGKKAKILDIGCGTGSFLRYLNWRGFENLTGIDVTENVTNEYNHITSDFMIFQSEDKFDVICSFMHIEHVKDVHAYIRLVKKILNDNGLVIINTIDDHSLLFFASRFLYKIGINFAAKRLYLAEHFNHFSGRSLSSLAYKNQLEKVEKFNKNTPLKVVDVGRVKFEMLAVAGVFFIYFLANFIGRQHVQTVILKKQLP